MELNELTSSLRDISNMRSASHFKRTICKMAAQRLEAQQTRITQLEAELKEERRWIPVEERLPDLVPCGAGTAYSEAVNILTSERKVLTAIWDGTEFITDAEFWEAEGEVITHWTPVLLPLPKRPEVDG